MPKDYTPPPEAADTYTRYKDHYEGERKLKPKMLEAADRDLKAGATVGQLAAWTGLTPEVFRRRARALGVERKRPPTVGKLTGAPPDTSPAAATPREQVTQSLPKPEPIDLTGISPEVAGLSLERVRSLAASAEARQPQWVAEIREEYPDANELRLCYLIVDTGFRQGRKPPELADTPAPDTSERPADSEEQTP